MRVAGVGFRSGCPAADIVAVVREAERRAGCRVEALATAAFKAQAPALAAAASQLGLPIHAVDRAVLERGRPVTVSAASLAATGLASVAEAACLAFGPLLLPRIIHGQATCAIAGLR